MNLSGKVFGNLTVLSQEDFVTDKKSKKRTSLWE